MDIQSKNNRYLFLLFLFVLGVVSGLLELFVFKDRILQIAYLSGAVILIARLNKKFE